MSEFAGKTVLVTGSSSGIGEATVLRFHELGANVMVNSSSSVEAGNALVESLGERAAYVQADISSRGDAERMVATTVAEFGGLDILVNNAGWTTVIPHDDLDALTDEVVHKTFEVNVFGTWYVTTAAMPHLREATDGNVITISSIAGIRPVGSSIAYSMSKAALNQMTKLLAKSHGPVRFNAVAPGLVATPWTQEWDAQHATVARISPLGRSATADDCAEAVLALARNKYTTGEVMVVDGGVCQVW